MKAADKNAPSEMAVNLMSPDTVPATLTQRRIVFPVSIPVHQLKLPGGSRHQGRTIGSECHEISIGSGVENTR